MGLLAKYFRIKEVTGVNIHVTAEGNHEIAVCKIELNNDQLSFQKKTFGLSCLEGLKDHVSKNNVVALNITGKAVLIKKVENTNPGFEAILPNANPEDFYIQQLTGDNASFVSLIRRQEADKFIETILSFGGNVLSLSLGPFSVANILPQLNFYEGQAIFDGHIVGFTDSNRLTSYRYGLNERAQFGIKAESEDLDEKLILPYAAAFQLLLADLTTPVEAEIEWVRKRYEDVVLSNKLRAQGALLLVTMFVALLVNFVLFSYLSTSNDSLAQKIGTSQQNYQDVSALTGKIETQKQLLQLLGWDGKSAKAHYIDSIARCVPTEVTITEIAVQPIVEKATGADSDNRFLRNTLRLAAYSKTVLPVNEWIERLKLQHWVKKISMESYKFDNETDIAKVTITINY